MGDLDISGIVVANVERWLCMGTVRGVLSHCPANWVERRVPPLYRHTSGGEGNPCNLPKSYSAYSISKLIFAVFCKIAEKEQHFSFDKLTASAAALSRPFRPRGRSDQQRCKQSKAHQPLCLRAHFASGERFAFLSRNANDMVSGRGPEFDSNKARWTVPADRVSADNGSMSAGVQSR